MKITILPFLKAFYFKQYSTLIINGVMFIVVGNGHGDTSSNSGRDWLHLT